jgi:anti-anti-sigma regulatory factor
VSHFVSPLAALRPRAAVLLANGDGPDAERTWDTLPVVGVPFVIRLLRSLEARGVERVLLHARRHGRVYRRLVGSGTHLGLHVIHADGPLEGGWPDLVARTHGLPADEPLLLQTSDCVVLERGEERRVLCVRGWDDLHALTSQVLAGGWSHSGALPPGGVELDALGVDDLTTAGSYAGRQTVVEPGAHLVQSSLEQGARLGAEARLERVVALPGAVIPCGAELRDGVLDGGRWIPLGSGPPTSALPVERPQRERWRPLRRLASRLLHGRGAPLRAEPRADALVIHAPTRLDGAAAGPLTELTWPAETLLVIDLADCQRVETEGCAALEALSQYAEAAGRRLALIDAPARLHDQLERAGVLERLRLYPTLAAAKQDAWRGQHHACLGGATC